LQITGIKELKISICKPDELGNIELDLWRSFQHQNRALQNAFLTPEFACVMSKRQPKIKVAVVENGGKIIAFFAFERLGFGVGRALCYGMSDAQGIVHAPDAELNGTELLAACGLDIWEFDHLISCQLPFFSPQKFLLRGSPVVDLTHGYDIWFSRKKSEKHIKQIFQRQRKLEREQGVPRFEYDTLNNSELELLMKWKSAQYRRTGRKDRFAQNWFADSVRELFETRTDNFNANLSTLYINDKAVSSHLTLCSNGVMSGWLPSYDTKYSLYGTGLILRLHLLKAAAANEIRLFDSGAGDHEYKNTFSNDTLEVAKGAVERPAIATYVRRLQTYPVRLATGIVLGSPFLRKAARESLAYVGSMRGQRKSD
jgi:CelD/BcsL family acetyltransferase involved in cellulose biosynthesis